MRFTFVPETKFRDSYGRRPGEYIKLKTDIEG